LRQPKSRPSQSINSQHVRLRCPPLGDESGLSSGSPVVHRNLDPYINIPRHRVGSRIRLRDIVTSHTRQVDSFGHTTDSNASGELRAPYGDGSGIELGDDRSVDAVADLGVVDVTLQRFRTTDPSTDLERRRVVEEIAGSIGSSREACPGNSISGLVEDEDTSR
jgi:hypothetical protein